MKLKYNTQITEITHDDLVNLFSTSLFGSNYLSAEYDKDFYNSLDPSLKKGDCFEDKLADTLLNGGKVYFFDSYSEGEVYASNGEVIENDYGEEYAMYSVTLTDIIKGLEKCTNGTYKTNDDVQYVKSCFDSLIDEDSCDFDYDMADALIQVILFNEIIYG